MKKADIGSRPGVLDADVKKSSARVVCANQPVALAIAAALDGRADVEVRRDRHWIVTASGAKKKTDS